MITKGQIDMNEEKDAVEAVIEAPVVKPIEPPIKEIPFTVDTLEPILRKTDDGTPVKILAELPSCPASQVLVKVLAHPDNDQKSYEVMVRGDSLIPRYRTTKESPIKPSDVIYKMPDIKVEAAQIAPLDENGQKIVDPAILERMAKARGCRGRKSDIDYSKIPDNISCSKCSAEKSLGKYQIGSRAKKAGISIDEFISTFLCSDCNPIKKGKRVSAKYASMPRELKCHAEGCSVVYQQHPGITEKQAAAKGVGFNEFCSTWLCKLHRPKKAHQFSAEGRAAREAQAVANGEAPKHRGRPANPLYAGIPKKTTCKTCQKEVMLTAQNVIDKAEIYGISIEKLIETYKCKSCGGKITKIDKANYKKRLKKELKEKKAN